jgi:uncharacterized OB-fold protein
MNKHRQKRLEAKRAEVPPVPGCVVVGYCCGRHLPTDAENCHRCGREPAYEFATARDLKLHGLIDAADTNPLPPGYRITGECCGHLQAIHHAACWTCGKETRLRWASPQELATGVPA